MNRIMKIVIVTIIVTIIIIIIICTYKILGRKKQNSYK